MREIKLKMDHKICALTKRKTTTPSEEGRRGQGRSCQLKMKVNGSSDGKSSEREYTGELQREVLFFWEHSQGQRRRAREGELDRIEDSLPSSRLKTQRRGGVELWW